MIFLLASKHPISLFSRAHISIFNYSYGISIYSFHMVAISKETTSSVQTQLVYFLFLLFLVLLWIWQSIYKSGGEGRGETTTDRNRTKRN